MDSLEDLEVIELQLVNKTPIVNFITKVLSLADEDVKRTIMVIFKDILMIGKNFHYEITNEHLAMIMIELLEFYNMDNSDTMTDFHIQQLLDSMDKIIEFKVTNNMLDFKTFIQIIEKDLETSCKDDVPKLWKSSYAKFIMKHLEEKSEKELTFRELEVIQKLIERDSSKFIKN